MGLGRAVVELQRDTGEWVQACQPWLQRGVVDDGPGDDVHPGSELELAYQHPFSRDLDVGKYRVRVRYVTGYTRTGAVRTAIKSEWQEFELVHVH